MAALASREAPRSCLVTVGTTKFEELVRVLDDERTIEALKKLGFGKLVMQIGHGEHDPKALVAAPDAVADFEVDVFRLSHEFGRYMDEASLVISHAGAGSILEALRGRKALIVVVNETLMENHQHELARPLAAAGYLYDCVPETLQQTLRDVDLSKLKPYPEPDVAFSDLLDAEL